MAQSTANSVPPDEEIDYTDIEEKYNVEREEGFDNVIVLDGLPVIDKAKYDKLVAKLCREFSKKGCSVQPERIHMPWDDTKDKSKGFAFIEFDTDKQAHGAISAMDGFQFDAKHRFALDRFSEVESFTRLDESFTAPTTEPYKQKEHLRAWLADEYGRDQYLIFQNDDVEIHWHGKPSQSDLVYKKANWTDLYTSWSPLGTYLATIHRQGVRLWGGPSWEPLQRFPHPLVKLIDFSPCENYMVTWSQDPFVIREGAEQGPQYPSPDDEGNSLAVWDIKTGTLLRTFPVTQLEQAGSEGGKRQLPWPALKWSPDDLYVARVTPGQQISVYELPGMGLLGKKSIKIDGVVDFEWCPMGEKDRDDSSSGKGGRKADRENTLAFWVPEVDNQPARVSLMSIPSRTNLRSKNLFNVTECKIYWQPEGDYLCVKVDRHTKTKKSVFCNLEIFRMREKNYPVEVIELKETSVIDFAWEPRGDRFVIISSNDPNLGNPGPGITIKSDVSFYQLEKGKNFKLLRTLSNRTTNYMRWSPKGRHLVLATVGSSSKSELEFWDLDFHVEETRKEGAPSKEEWGAGSHLLGTSDHYGVTDVEWDPSGRYLATSASAWRHQLEHGYAIWDFRGQEILKQLQDRFKQFLWRPRPRTLLSKEEQKQVRKTLKEYSRAFEEEDAAEQQSANASTIAHRKRLVDEWNAWRLRVKQELATETLAEQNEVEQEEVQEWVEEILEQTEEIVEDE